MSRYFGFKEGGNNGATPTPPSMSNADILLNYPQESLVYFTEVATPTIGKLVTDSTTNNSPGHTYVVAQAATVKTVINTFASKNLLAAGYLVPCVFTQSGTNLVLKKAYTELPLAPYQAGYNFFDVSTNPITLEVGERLGYRVYGGTEAKSLLLVFPTETTTVKTYAAFDLTTTTLDMTDTTKAVKTWLPAVGAFTDTAAEVIKQGLPPAAGLKYTSFGDSITWYDKKTFSPSHIENGKLAKGYQSYIVDSYGYTLDNQGVSSIDLTQISATKILPYNFADTHITTIMSGANDARKGVPVGTIAPIGSTFATNTYAGAMQKAIEHIISSNPKTIIVLITPIRGWYAEHSTSDVPNTDPNVVGVMSKSYPDMVKAIGDLYGLPVVDFYYGLGWNDLNKHTYLGDNPALFTAYLLHPTTLGFKRMGKMLTDAIKYY